MRRWMFLFGLPAVGCTPMPCSGGIPYTEGACVEAPRPAAENAWIDVGGVGPIPNVHLYAVGDCDNGQRIMTADRDCVFGVTYGMEVYVGPADWRTSVAHEFLHVAFGQEYGDRDPDHLRPEWAAQLPQEVGKDIP